MRCEIVPVLLFTSLAATAQPSLQQMIELASVTTVMEFDEKCEVLGFKYKNIIHLKREAEKDTAFVELIYVDGKPTDRSPDLLGLLLVGGWTPKVYLSGTVDMSGATRKYASEHSFRSTTDCLVLQDPRSSDCACWTNNEMVIHHCRNAPTPEGHTYALWVYSVKK